MNLDQMVADAKERLHRSIGQRARWAKHDLAERAYAVRMLPVLRERITRYELGKITGR